MTSRADLPRLAASLGVLGTELESKGHDVWDRLGGWQPGPQPAPSTGVRGGGGSETAAEDRRAEAAQARRAGKHLEEFRMDLAALDMLVQSLNKRIDLACPPDITELRNRRTGEMEFVETAGDIAAAGYCTSCWRNDKQLVVREKAKKSGLYYSPTLCRWCADVKRTYNVEPPLEVLKLHHAGRRISVQAMTEAIEAATPKKNKSKKKRKGKAA